MATAPTADPETVPPIEPPDDSQSHGRRIAGATGIMMAAILASRILGLIRNAIISHRLGQDVQSDVFWGAFQIPDLLFYLIAGGALSSSFIPVFTDKITHGKRKEAWHVFSTVACVMFVVISGLVIIGELFADPLTRMVNPGFARVPGKVEATVPLTRIILPAQLCFFLGGLMMGAQQSMQKFKIPALGPVIYNAGIIFGGIALFPLFGVAGFCWGALLGAVVGNFLLQLWAVRREGMEFKPSFDYRNPDVVQVWKLMLPVVLGVALPQVSIWINRWYASELGNGPMSALSYANQAMQVPLGLFAQAMAVAIFPTLSALAAQGRHNELRAVSSGGIRTLLFITIPASVFMIVLALPMIQFLNQSGKFTTADSRLAAGVLAVYCIGIFAWSAQSILSRSFYALKDSITPVVIGTLVTLVFIPMNGFFMRDLHMGVRGLALATTIAASLHAIVMTIVLRKRLNGFEMGRMASSVGKTVLASAIAGAACWAVRSALGEAATGSAAHVKLHAAITLTLGFGIGTAIFLTCAAAFRMVEMQQAFSILRRRRKTI